MRALTRMMGLLANGLFVAAVFAIHPRKTAGVTRAGWVRPSNGPARERRASLGLLAGWSMQLLSIARPSRRRGRRQVVVQLVVALAVLAASLRLAISAQNALGPAWRTSVTGTGLAPLSTGGPYHVIRHPVYTAMMGVVMANLLVGRPRLAAAGAVVAGAGIQLQVRGLEEPALRTAYGDAYRSYSAVTGRFVPLVGRIPSERT